MSKDGVMDRLGTFHGNVLETGDRRQMMHIMHLMHHTQCDVITVPFEYFEILPMEYLIMISTSKYWVMCHFRSSHSGERLTTQTSLHAAYSHSNSSFPIRVRTKHETRNTRALKSSK